MAGSLQPQLMTVNDLFAGSLFQVPDYQRAYAWEQKQWDDLWEDLREGMRTGTTHFLGTVVLMAQEESRYDAEGRPLRVFDVVDGQQRLTTLCLLLLAVFDHVRKTSESVSRGIWRDFVEHEEGVRKLHLGGLNREYFDSLVSAVNGNEQLPSAHRSTDGRLRGAVRRLQDLIEAWLEVEGTGANTVNLASYVRENLQVLRFVTDSQPLAIKIFQSVNDRGKELSLLDKSKSFLMFYLTRYLQKDTDAFQAVESTFSGVFDNYDAVRDLAQRYKVDYLISPQYRFNEDEFLRYAYHYGCNDFLSRFKLPSGYEYGITPEHIFDRFVKDGCHELRDRPTQLRDFILAWCDDLLAVSAALVRLLDRIPTVESHRRLFQFQHPSASIYPLLVAAEARGVLDEQMLQAISILDLRVYQVRGTDPKADLYRNAVATMKTGNPDDILGTILRYCRDFGSDQELGIILQGHVFKQSFAKYVLWNFAVRHDKEVSELDYELFKDCQMEHILPQEASTFDVTTFGFGSEEDYELTKHGFGNLTPLEERLNKRAQNVPPADKAPIYAASRLAENRAIGTRIREAGFRREQQGTRTDDIVRFFKTRWPIPSDARNAGLVPAASP
jgi:hypothetical protein